MIMINIIDDDITDIMTLDLDGLRENERFEAKRCEGKLTSEFWPTYSAFANTFGGDIALGLKEDPNDRRRLIAVGVGDPDKILNELWTQVNNPQKVSVNLLSEGDVRIEDVDGRNVIIVHVPRAERQKRPVFINGNMNSGTYRRNGEGDYHCSVTEIAEMLRDSRDEPMDTSLCSKVLLRDLEKETVGAYRRMMSNRVPSHPWNKEPDDEFLRLIGAARRDDGVMRPTIAGLIMFGNDYAIMPEVPGFFLDYREYNSNSEEWTLRRFSGAPNWTGNLFDFYIFVTNRIPLMVGTGFTVPDGMNREDDTLVIRALREVVTNALVHADYWGRGGTVIEMRPDSFTARNPGTFRIPLKEAEAGGTSDPRNRALFKMFNLIGRAERAGSGIRSVIRACRSQGLRPPVMEELCRPDAVRITITLKRDNESEMTSRVLDMIRRDPRVTIAHMAGTLAEPKSSVINALNRLKEDGMLERVGGTRGYWRIRRCRNRKLWWAMRRPSWHSSVRSWGRSSGTSRTGYRTSPRGPTSAAWSWHVPDTWRKA